jgi:adenylate kinase
LGNEAQEYVHRGDLVPDNIMIEFMRERLTQPDTEVGWILEGYPRTAFQAEELDFLLDELEKKLDWAIYLEVGENVMIDRSLKRGEVDDKLEIIKRRIKSFHKETFPILEYYSFKKKLLTINGENTPLEIEKKLLSFF